MGKRKKRVGKRRKVTKKTKPQVAEQQWLEPVSNSTLQMVLRFIKTLIFHFF
jgi:hypothetical protein